MKRCLPRLGGNKKKVTRHRNALTYAPTSSRLNLCANSNPLLVDCVERAATHVCMWGSAVVAHGPQHTFPLAMIASPIKRVHYHASVGGHRENRVAPHWCDMEKMGQGWVAVRPHIHNQLHASTMRRLA